MEGIARRLSWVVVAIAMVVSMVAVGAPAASGAGASSGSAAAAERAPKGDQRPHPLGSRQALLREKALDAELNGKAHGKTHEVARGQYVELAREGEDAVWTVLGEFADFRHNNIAEPNRDVDNTTIWVSDFSRDYFMDLLFDDAPGANSMRNYYLEQSSNRYTVNGDVTDWVEVPGNAADYDDGDPGPGDAFHVWQFLVDSTQGWYDAQRAEGKTPEEIDAYLSRYDTWDRYDWDSDGVFDEPDGYIDHFQSLHAGEGNEAGGGALGDAAIWSHSWYAYSNLIGAAGPSPDYMLGGLQIGESSYWIGDYTIQPENGGVGVFTHEYGHDLGLPDLYDVSGGENGTGFWTLMSSGSWLNDGADDIGSKPGHMGAWEKFQLGWLNYEVAFAGQKSRHKLGPAETNSRQAQGLFVVLPQKPVMTDIGDPYAGEYFYYSGSGNNLDNTMVKQFDLAPGSSLRAKVRYEIELDWDYAYVVVSEDGGATWEPVDTNLSSATDPHGQNFGHGITGTKEGWTDLVADLSGYTGNVLLGFQYWTDGVLSMTGFMADDIQVSGYPTDGAETDTDWTFDGFHVTQGLESGLFNHYYVGEFRQYRGYDSTLRTGPYNFGFLDDDELVNLVEHFPYQDGLLVSYWDTSQLDNNVKMHPGHGLLLPIDAHPGAMIRPDGGVWRNRIQTYDSTFGFERTDPIALHWDSAPFYQPSLPAVSVFDDRTTYYDPANPWGSVMDPDTGTQIRIASYSAQGNFMLVHVNPAK